MAHSSFNWRDSFQKGAVIPAHPLALTAERKLDERRQRALTKYYLAAGAGGIAVGVHTTQFQIHDSKVGLYEPVLALAADAMGANDVIRVAGVCGDTAQATREAEIVHKFGYHAVLLNLSALSKAPQEQVLDHARAIGEIVPVIGFYLQPAVGGQYFPVEFWRAFAAIESVVGIKIAPFNRYATQDVL
ncbi:MAG: dihydrodipicolinate synthase family protein, partial [Edaphobacter sp.]